MVDLERDLRECAAGMTKFVWECGDRIEDEQCTEIAGCFMAGWTDAMLGEWYG